MINKLLIQKIKHSLTKEPGIILAYILGSSASGRVREDSDFDLAVIVDDQKNTSFKHIYKMVSQINFPKNLDLSVVDKNSSPIFLFQITSTGKCIYLRSDKDKIYFEAFVMKNYYDSAHLRKIYYNYLKDKFSYANK